MKTTIKVTFEGNSTGEINEQIFAYLSTQKGFFEAVEPQETAMANDPAYSPVEPEQEVREPEEITEG